MERILGVPAVGGRVRERLDHLLELGKTSQITFFKFGKSNTINSKIAKGRPIKVNIHKKSPNDWSRQKLSEATTAGEHA